MLSKGMRGENRENMEQHPFVDGHERLEANDWIPAVQSHVTTLLSQLVQLLFQAVHCLEQKGSPYHVISCYIILCFVMFCMDI